VIRELVAHHNPAVLTPPHVSAVLAVHQAVPALSLIDLLAHATRPGPASRAIEHAHECGECRLSALCPAGELLARAIGPRRPRWRPAA
jgi:hypothetical protein